MDGIAPQKRKGRPPSSEKSVTVKVAIAQGLNAHLLKLVGFGWGRDTAEVMRTIVTGEVRRLQNEGRLTDEP